MRLSRALSQPDLDAIADLERRVVAADGGRLKLSWPTLHARTGDRVEDALWFDGDTLLGFAGIYAHGAVPEIAGMVDPAARRRGIGSALLRALLEELASRWGERALLVCPRTTGAGAAFARALGGTPDHAEHALVLHGPASAGPRDPAVTVRPARAGDEQVIGDLLADGFDFTAAVEISATDPDSAQLVAERAGEVVGYLRTELDRTAEEPRGDVYGFVVRPDLRGQGIGRDVLRRCCADLFTRGAAVVGLEVETENEHALGLYTSLGFRPVVTEEYLGLTVRA